MIHLLPNPLLARSAALLLAVLSLVAPVSAYAQDSGTKGQTDSPGGASSLVSPGSSRQSTPHYANFLPNPQWQAWTGNLFIRKQNESGTGPQMAVSAASFTTTNTSPTFLASNTHTIRPDDLVVLGPVVTGNTHSNRTISDIASTSGITPGMTVTGSGILPGTTVASVAANSVRLSQAATAMLSGNYYSFVGYKWAYRGAGPVTTPTASRVASIRTNTSITLSPAALGAVSPAVSAPTVMSPIAPGDNGTGNGQAADGWKKTGTLVVWADDWASNACPGAIRTMGVRKQANSSETLSWTVAPNQIKTYRGRTVTFGVLVYQKVGSGAGTWHAYINDDETGTTFSARGAGPSYSDRSYGHFQLLTVTSTVGMKAKTLSMGIAFDGAGADVYYVALPTGVFGTTLFAENLGLPPTSFIRPVTHWNPPLLTPLTMTFPSTPYPGTDGTLFGYSGQDLEAMSLGQVHNSVVAVAAKIELTTSTAGGNLFTGSRLDYSLIFGPQVVTQVPNVINVGQGWMPLADDGTFAIFVASPALSIQNATFDFWSIQLSGPSSAN